MRSMIGVVAMAVLAWGCGASSPKSKTPGSPPCTPQTCTAAGSACGPTPDGCGGVVACGSCGDGQICTANACVPGSCTPVTCQAAGAACGDVADGCGGSLACGDCPAGLSCSGNACVPPAEQRGSTRWARAEGGSVSSVAIGFGHFGVLVDGGVLETWSTDGTRTSSAQIAPLGDDDFIVAGPSFVLARGADHFTNVIWIRLHDWSGALQRTVASTNDYGVLGIPAVSAAGRIAWTDLVSPGSPPPQTASLHVEDADGSNVATYSSADMVAGSVAFDPAGDVDVVVRAAHPGTFFGRSFGASGAETALVQLARDGHLVAVEGVDGAVRFDVPADGNRVAVDPKGRVAVAGGGSVAYFDLTGARQWSRTFDATIRDVAIAEDGSVVVVGAFQGTVDFGTGPLTAGPGGSGFVVDLAP